MTTESNAHTPCDPEHVRHVVTRLFRAVEETDATAYYAGTYHPEVTIHESPCLPYGGTYRGLYGAKAHARAFLRTWARHQTPSERAMGAAIDTVTDHAYVRWTLHVAEREFPFISHYAFRDGLIVEARMFPFDAPALADWYAELEAGPSGRTQE